MAEVKSRQVRRAERRRVATAEVTKFYPGMPRRQRRALVRHVLRGQRS
jgi:hypothetical protein